jgi:transcriptional regulator with XRE-family HTH domain
MASLLSEAARETFVRRVRIEMAKAGLTREALAERAACKERTLGNLLAGQPVRDQTVAKVARVLGIDLDELVGSSAGTSVRRVEAQQLARPPESRAGEEYGGYLLSAYTAYLGTYVAYRRALSNRDELVRSVYEIGWDDDLSRLRFFELQRFRGADARTVSSSHAGGIHISPHTGLLHLLTTFQGALRLVTLTKFRMGDDKLRGVILTQRDRDVFFQPAVSAIYLEKLPARRKSSELERLVGPLGPADQAFAAASRELADIEQNTVLFAGPAAKPA